MTLADVLRQTYRDQRNAVPRYRVEDVMTISEREDAAASGLPPDAFEAIWRAIGWLYRSGLHPSVTVCLRHRGHVILERSIGHARGNGPGAGLESVPERATPATLYNMFSAAKAVTAMLVHHLDDQGLLHVGDRVADYIPEFGAHGKDRVTLRHVLAHRGGVPTVQDVPMQPDLLADPEAVLDMLCRAKPESKPGRRVAYHAITGGFLLQEVMERVSGKPIRTLLDEIIRVPLGFDTFQYGVEEARIPQVAEETWTGPNPPGPIRRLFERGFGVSAAEACELANDPTFLTGIVPSGNIIGTADEMCRFMELLRNEGELDGVRIFEPRTVRRAVGETSYLEFDDILKLPIRYGAGFMLGDRWLSFFGPNTQNAYGHLGFTRSLLWADPDREVSCAFLSNGKPLIGPDIPLWLNVPRTIAAHIPRSAA